MGLRDSVREKLRGLLGADRAARQDVESPTRDARQFSPVFAGYGLNAYDTNDRVGLLTVSQALMDAFADYEAMAEYPPIGCVAAGQVVYAKTGAVLRPVPIEDLVMRTERVSDIAALDIKRNRIVGVTPEHPRLTHTQAEVVKIPLSNLRTLRLTPEHRVLTPAGYVEAQNLRKNDLVVTLPAGMSLSGESMLTVPNPGLARVLEDPTPDGKADVYDISTSTQNFICEGVVVHNSAFRYFASDTVQPSVVTGRSIWVESKDRSLVGIGNDLLHRRLRVEDELYSQAYTLVQYGNAAEEILVGPDGVVGLNHLPPPTLRRIERDDGVLAGYVQDITGQFTADARELRRMLTSGSSLPKHLALFEDWQVVHMRFRATSRRSTYGRSVAEPARWVWKRLILLDDAVMLHKLCLRGDSRVWTPKGYTEIRDLHEGDVVYCFSDDQVPVPTVVTYKRCNGRDTIYRVRGQTREIYANATHPVLIERRTNGLPIREYVEVQDIRPGRDRIITPSIPFDPRSGAARLRVPAVKNQKTSRFALPDKTFSRLAGFVFAAGQVLSDEIVFPAEPEYVLYARRLTCDQAPVEISDGYACVKSALLARVFKLNGIDEKRRVPAWVYRARTTNAFDFLVAVADAMGDFQETEDGLVLLARNLPRDTLRDLETVAAQSGLRARLEKDTLWIYAVPASETEVVEAVEEVGSDHIYDIGVRHAAHNFIADGVVVHNTRTPNRFAFTVDVTGLPPARIKSRLERFTHNVERRQLVDPRTGRLDSRNSPLCLTGDTLIPLTDGRRLSLRELVREYEDGKDNEVYALDRSTFSMVKGKIAWAGLTRSRAQILRIFLDNGGVVRATPDHKLIRGNGDFVEAQDLRVGDILMGYEDGFRPVPNRSVVMIRWQRAPEDTYTLTIEPAGTFALSAGIFVKNSSDEYFVFASDNGRDLARVETLNGADYQAMEPVDYFRRMLYSALSLPPNYLGEEGPVPQRSILSHDDPRAARITMTAQQEIRRAYEHIIRVHLAARGHPNPLKADFSVRMTIPSGIYELAHYEILNARADYASRVQPWVSERWVQENILRLSDGEIEQIKKDREAAAQAGGGGPALSSIQVPDSVKRLEEARYRESVKRHDELMEQVERLLQSDVEFRRRHMERLRFLESLLEATGRRNGR